MIKKTFSENFQMAALDHGTPMGCEGKGGPAAGIPNLHGTGKNGGFWSVIQLFNSKKWVILPKKRWFFEVGRWWKYHVHSMIIPWFTVFHRNFPQESQLVIFQGKLTTGKNCDLHKLVTFSKFWKIVIFQMVKKKHFCWSGFTCPLGLPMKLGPACEHRMWPTPW